MEKEVFRSISFLFAVTILAGCATKVDLIALQSLNGQKRSFDFFDLRPADQFFTHTEREERGDRTYYGDDVVIPSRAELLADRLQSALGKELAGKSVIISTFRLQTVQPTNRGGPSYASSGNPIADVIGTAIGRELMAASTRSKELYANTQIVGKIDEEEINIDAAAQMSAQEAANGLARHVQDAIEAFTKKDREVLSAVQQEVSGPHPTK